MHVNIETLVARFPRRGRVLCTGATQVIILLCATAMIWGTLRLHPLNATMRATVSGIPMNWVSDILIVGGIGFFIIAFARLLRLLTGQISDAEIAAFAGQYHVEEKQ